MGIYWVGPGAEGRADQQGLGAVATSAARGLSAFVPLAGRGPVESARTATTTVCAGAAARGLSEGVGSI